VAEDAFGVRAILPRPEGRDLSRVWVNPSEVLNVVDYGDTAIDYMSTERSMEHVRSMIKEIALTAAIPIIIGGDHSLMYSDASALAQVHGKGNARSPDAETFEWMREQGFRYHTMVEIEKRGWDVVMNRAVHEAKEGPRNIFISFDIDVMDPGNMTGTGTPVPGGLTIREAQPIARRLYAGTHVVGFLSPLSSEHGQNNY
jgi:arginase family enzyme